MTIPFAPEQHQNDLAAFKFLYEISTLPVCPDNLPEVLQKIVDAAIGLSGADKGNIQLFNGESGMLEIIAHRGYDGSDFLELFASVDPGNCLVSFGEAFARRKRVVTEDIMQSPLAGTPALGIGLEARIRGVWSTPLISRNRRTVGILNLNYSHVIRETDLDTRYIDLLAGQAADIIVQVEAQQELAESEERLRMLVQATALAVWETDAKGMVFHDSPTWRAYTGQTFEAFLGNGWLEAIHPDDREYVERRWRKTLEIGRIVNDEFRIRGPNGDWRWTNVRATPIRKPDGTIAKWIGMFLDISERKQVEIERKNLLTHIDKQYARLGAIIDSLPIALWIADASGKIVLINEIAYNIWAGVHFAQNISEYSKYKFWWADTGELVAAEDMPLARALRGEICKDLELDFERFDGTRGTQLVSSSPITVSDGTIIGGICLGRDITRRRRLENELRESEEKYRQLFNSIDQGIFIIDVIYDENDRPIDMFYVDANPAAIRILGRDFTGKRLREIEPGYEDDWYEIFGRVALTGESVWMEKYSKPDNKWFDIYAFKVGGPDSRRMSNIFQDITGRKQMEDELRLHRDNLAELVDAQTQQLRQSERNYRALVENAPVVIARWDKNLRYLYRSPGPGGMPTERFIGKTFEEVGLPESAYILWQEKLKEVLQTGLPVEFETQFPNRKGEIKQLLARIVPEPDEIGQVESLLGFSIDLTERKKLEAELQRLERLNLIGEMAVAISHEVRNPMTTVRGYLQMFQRREKNEGYKEQLNTMIEELDRANSILSEFLSLAKDKKIDKKPTYLNAVIRKLMPLLQAEAVRDGKEILTSFAGVPKVFVDENEIRQCILNLAQNALDAVPTGGIVTLTTDWDGQSAVCLSVRDNGPGIPAEVLNNLGKPFTTTKEKGTGLGLSVCYRIAQRNNARIDVRSSPQGTTFGIYFKISQN